MTRVVAVLITGMSGSGKTTALEGLARLGYDTVETDDPAWLEVVDGEPLWREPMIEALLDERRDGPLFVQGTVANQGRFAHRFAAVVLLAAPLEVLLDRVRRRTDNPFGRSASSQAKIAADHADVEPLLRASATHVLDAEEPPEEVVEALVRIARAG